MKTSEPFKQKQEEIKRNFFDYYLDHCCICTNKDCICKASTTKDTLCTLRDITMDEVHQRELQEAIDK